MENLNQLGWIIPAIIAVVFCTVALLIIGVVALGLWWGFKRGSVRVARNERNFDDFGR